MNRLLIVVAAITSILAFSDSFAAAGGGWEARACKVVRDQGGTWWFQRADGTRFYSLGVNNVTPEPFRPQAGTDYYNPVPEQFGGRVDAWASSVAELLSASGFNTLGAWSSLDIPTGREMVAAPVLYVVEHEHTRCLSPIRPDFEEFVRANVKAAVAKIPAGAHLLGVFLDNEMPWYGKSGWDDLPNYTLLEQAFELPASDARRKAALEFLIARHPDAAAFAAAYERPLSGWEQLSADYLTRCVSPAAAADREAFTALLADRFYEVTTRIVRAEMPGVLILGTRIPGNAPDAVIRACGRHCDVMSLNQYLAAPRTDEYTLTRFRVLGGRPIMHTEFSWRARQNASGNPNSRGAGTVVDTQADRAAAYRSLIADMATVPYVIGSHWFEFADQSPQGRFDGEDSNYGIVDIRNRPYVELLDAMRQTNAEVHSLHAESQRVMPDRLPESLGVTYLPGQHPGRAPTLNLLGKWTCDPEIWGAPDASLRWRRDGDAVVLEFDSGEQYGAGINIFGPESAALSRGPTCSTDLDGYASFVLEAIAPDGVQINLVLAEAGAAPASAARFDTSAGDDAEAFVSPTMFGEGKLVVYRVPIDRLTKQKYFGNQLGKSRIEMNAIRNVGLQISGKPRHGEVRVFAFRLEK